MYIVEHFITAFEDDKDIKEQQFNKQYVDEINKFLNRYIE